MRLVGVVVPGLFERLFMEAIVPSSPPRGVDTVRESASSSATRGVSPRPSAFPRWILRCPHLPAPRCLNLLDTMLAKEEPHSSRSSQSRSMVQPSMPARLLSCCFCRSCCLGAGVALLPWPIPWIPPPTEGSLFGLVRPGRAPAIPFYRRRRSSHPYRPWLARHHSLDGTPPQPQYIILGPGVSSGFRRLVLVRPPCCLALHPHRRRVRHGRLDRGGAVRGGTRDQGQGGGRSGGPPPSASCLGLLREWALLWGFGRAYRDELVAVEAAAASANPLLPGGWEGPALAASLLRRVTISTMVARCRHRSPQVTMGWCFPLALETTGTDPSRIWFVLHFWCTGERLRRN